MTELHDFERQVRTELLRTVESVNPPQGAAERAIAAARAGAESQHLRQQRVRHLILPLAAAAAAVVLVAGVSLVSRSSLDDSPAGPSPSPQPSVSPSPSVTPRPSGAATGAAVAPSPTSTSTVPATKKVVIPPAGAAAGNPSLIGHLDSVSVQAGQVSLHGWAADTRTPGQSINVGYSITNGTQTVSGRIRAGELVGTAVGRAYPTLGNNHGFNTGWNSVAPGDSTVCAWAMDPAGGANRSIGCTTARVPADIRARGHLDSVRSLGSGQIQVSGWAVDDNTPTTPVRLAIYLGSATAPYKTVSVTANQASPAAGAAYPLIGANHGFSATIPARPGTQPVCAWAIDTYMYGGPTLLGCLNVTA